MAMPAIQIDPLLTFIVRGSVFLLLMSAALTKLRQLSFFRGSLNEYELLPSAWVPAAAVVIPFVELAIAVLLVFSSTLNAGLVTAAALLTIYACAMAVNLLRGRADIDCGCTGPAQRQLISGMLVGRNLVLAGFALSATLPAIERALGWADYAVAMLAIAAATSLYIAANQLFANRPRLDALDDYMGAAS